MEQHRQYPLRTDLDRPAATLMGGVEWTRTPDGVLVVRYRAAWPTRGDRARSHAALAASGLARPGTPILVDLRQVADADGLDRVRGFLARMPQRVARGPHRRAYLLREAGQESQVRTIQAHVEVPRIETEVFLRWDDALDWLRGRR